MKSLIIAGLAVLMLVGCEAKTEDQTSDYRLPQELVEKGCKIYRMEGNGTVAPIKVVYCPNSNTTTSYRASKSNINTAVITGE